MKNLRLLEDFKTYNINEVPMAVSHHIGNPVDAVDSYLQLARKYLEKNNIKGALEMINEADKAVENAKSIINDFRVGNINFK
jgi:phosphoglycerate-specific signal transduction histidine kinase